MKYLKKADPVYLLVPLSVLAVVGVIAAFTGEWPWNGNPYNSYVLQADSWLRGRLDLINGENYSWLELAVYEGKYYVSFPPFPSYVMLPFVLVFGTAVPDHWIALAVMVTGAVYAVRLYKTLAVTPRQTEFFVLFLYLASGLLFVCINGYVWFIAQNMCFTLSLMSLFYAVRGKGGWALALWACAVGCRPMVVLYLPVLGYILWKGWKEKGDGTGICSLIRKRWYWGMGATLIALSYMILNYLRFGSVLEFGHNYLPEFTRTRTGQFHISYLAGNLKNLLRLPVPDQESHALQFPTDNGMAFWLAAPLFLTIAAAWLYAMIRKRRQQMFLLILLPLLALLHVLFICSHRTLGGWHFGNRYLLDLLPYLFYGLLVWKPQGEWFARWNMPLFYLGLSLQLIGTAATYNHWI